jgi:hypothetical protein
VDQAEERALVHAAAADVEGRANVLLHQLDNADRCGVGGFFLLSVLPLLRLMLLSNREQIVCVSEVTVELEGLRTAVDAFLDFLEVALGTREDQLCVARRCVTTAIESGVRHSAEVSLAMVEVSVEADFIEVIRFPAAKPLRFHEDLVARYGPAKEAVAALVPTQQILVELPCHATP